jgi:hypothetical protein
MHLPGCLNNQTAPGAARLDIKAYAILAGFGD